MVKKKKPVMEHKVGNVKIQLWKNKNKKGTQYLTAKFWIYRFPFKYNQSINLTMPEVKRLKELLETMPQVVLKEKKK